MILSFCIFMFSAVVSVVDTSVASAIEAMIASRTSAVHEIEYRSVPRELTRLEPRTTVAVVDEPRAAYRGYLSVPVELVSSVGVRKRYILSIRVRTFESVVVAAVTIDRHQEILPGQTVMQNIETTQMNTSPITDADGVVRKRSRQIIAAGRVITGSLIEPLPMIASGSPVTVVVRNDNVTLSVPGTAKTDGWEGSVIPVDVQSLKKQLTAKVLNATKVEVIGK
jgi:flagella basal body P-ring formation protein FlgA